ncbi:hypothetical protein BJ165DRAFT_1032323 [Panaeolus papilionaceus]|nr:hypothetical protein BJ165DRAFT_1032323 [Panaeolus papilionaceus]
MMLPKEITTPSRKVHLGDTYMLPQTLTDFETGTNVTYEVILQLVWGPFHPDDELIMPLGFIPIIRPPTLPMMCQRAYLNDLPLDSPFEDPQSWHSLAPVEIMRGVDGNHLRKPVVCTLFLAKPLSYTRGSFIPLFISVDGGAKGIVDVLTSLPAFPVCLLQRSIIGAHLAGEELPSSAWKVVKDASNMAVWRSNILSDAGIRHGTGAHQRTLHGELHLPADLNPTTHIFNFQIEYAVALFPMHNTGSVSTGKRSLVIQPINVATSYAAGPQPKSMVLRQVHTAQ